MNDLLGMDNSNEDASLLSSPQQRKWILAGACVALMAVIAAVSGLNVSQQQMAVALNSTQNEVFWIVNIYAVSLAALLLPMGAVGDRVGSRDGLIYGLILFSLANVISFAAPNLYIMLFARTLSGVAAALVMPVTLAVITSNFPKDERSKAIGIWTAVAGGGGIIGMFLSAFLVDVVSWRWLFVLPVILAIVSLAITIKKIPNSTPVVKDPFDFYGAFWAIISVLSMIIALDSIAKSGWCSSMALGSMLAGVIGTICFINQESRSIKPLLELRFLSDKSLLMGAATLFVLFGVQAGVFIVIFPYFQSVLHWSGLKATSALMPMAFVMMAASGMGSKITKKIGLVITIALGVLLSGLGLAYMAMIVSFESGYMALLPGMLAWGIGTGLAMAPSTEIITWSIPPEKQGVASAINDLTRELGTALGVTILAGVFATQYHSSVNQHQNSESSELWETIHMGIAHAIESADQSFIQIAKVSFIDGWRSSMWAGVLILAMLFMYILATEYIGNDRRKKHAS